MSRTSVRHARGMRRHGLGLLLSKRTRLLLVLALIGSGIVASTEIIALAVVVPIMSIMAGEEPTLGPLGPANEFFGTTSEQTAIWLAAILFGAYLIKGIVGLGYRWWVGGFLARQQVDTSSKLFSYFLRADYSLHLRRTQGDFIRRMNDAVNATYSGVIMGVVSIATEFLTVLAILAALLVADPIPALGMLLYFGITSLILYSFTKRHAHATGLKLLSSAEQIFNYAVQPLASIKDVKLRDNSAVFVAKYRAARWVSAQAGRVSAFLTELPKFILEILFIGGVALLTVFLFASQNSSAAVATLALFAVAGFRLLPSLTRLMASTNLARVNLPSLDMVVDEFIAMDKKLEVQTSTAEPVNLTSDITLQSVDFHYDGSNQAVLSDISVTVPVGTSMGIVGTSGAGKSTLVDLIMGFHRPTGGVVTADGSDVHANLRGWQQLIGLVPQDVHTLSATVLENITFLDEDPDRDRAVQAAERAQLAPVIENLPQGYETQIGPGGTGLSGGQRQRLGLARALYRDPSLLVLDEATSALDNETEHHVTQAIQNLSGETTVLVIAHRLSTVRHCDRIAFMENGQIVAYGTFDEVVTQSPSFARLVELASLRKDDDL